MKMRFRLIYILTTLLIFNASFKGETTEISLSANLSAVKRDTIINSPLIKTDTFNLTVLPPSSGVQFYRDGIIFNSSSKFETKIPDNHISFGKEGTRYGLLKDGYIENIVPFSSNLPFTFPCEATTFSSDYNTMYFTRYSESDRSLKIYKAVYNQGNNGQWTIDQMPLNFCSDNSDYSHPALSYDGKQLIFASNRNGSVGGLDLFVSYEKGGSWSEPVNLGEGINTKSDELYPYLDSENNLFFSSEGRKDGHGGYDLYFSKFNGSSWENPVNLTAINTESDDVALTIDRKNGRSGFFVIKRKDGKRSVHLCRVEMNQTSSDTKQTLGQYFSEIYISPLIASQQVKTAPTPEESAVPVEESLIAETMTSVPDERKKDSEIPATDKSAETGTVSKPAENAKTESSAEKRQGVVVYRIQFESNIKPKGSHKITIDGKTYDTYEYQYAGAYRTTVGEFSSLSSATEFQSLLRKSGYSQSFVVAFKNGARSNDPTLFRK